MLTVRAPRAGKIMKQGIVVSVVLIALGWGIAASQSVQFSRELIRIAVAEDAVEVEGSYIFTNNSSRLQRQPLFYPFPVDSLHPFPGNVSVACDGEAVPFEVRDRGVTFMVDVPARGQAVLRVEYRQACLDGTACYILTTTAAWKSALEVARFEITVPDSLELVETPYPVDEVLEGDGARIHVIDREDFLPDRDLCIRWTQR